MNYKRVYYEIINRRQCEKYEGYTETHHIIPRSLGGADSKDNLVKLSAREHFICHYLLLKIYKPGTFYGDKMLKAFMMMLYCKSSTQDRYFTSRTYERLRENFSKIQSKQQQGKNNSQYGTIWVHSVELKKNKKISTNAIIELGWEIGRVIKWDLVNHRLELRQEKARVRQQKKQHFYEMKQQEFEPLYTLYNQVGFKEFCRITGYPRGQSTLCIQFKKYLGMSFNR